MIYICVPSHDEGQTIGVVLWKVRQVLGEASRDYQILVADDGSSDKTAAVLEPYTRVLPLTVMRTEERRGFAASLEMLLREAVHRSEYPRRDVVVVLQADFTEDPTHITTLLKRLESGADVVVSSAVGEPKVPVKDRLARVAERLVLRGKGLPAELSDPLVGFHAYRVSALRRAFEEDTTRRLLRFEGRAANVALLAAVLPHARRVDAVEWTPRPERRQRASRHEPGARLRQVWAFARGREKAGLIPVAGLAPSSVRTARTSEHEVSAEALREAGVTRPGEEERPRRRRGGNSRNGKARPGVKDGRRVRRSEEDGGRSKQSAGEEGDTARKRRRRKPKSEPVAPESSQSTDDAGEAGEETGPRKRRSRRRRRSKPAGESSGTEQPTAETEAAEAGPGEAGADGGEDGSPKARRRRGRRGGRRRSGRTRNGDDKASDAGPAEGTEAPSDGS